MMSGHGVRWTNKYKELWSGCPELLFWGGSSVFSIIQSSIQWSNNSQANGYTQQPICNYPQLYAFKIREVKRLLGSSSVKFFSWASSGSSTGRLCSCYRKCAFPKFKELHWLPIYSQTQVKILLLTFEALYSMGPEFLKNCCVSHEPVQIRISPEVFLQILLQRPLRQKCHIHEMPSPWRSSWNSL